MRTIDVGIILGYRFCSSTSSKLQQVEKTLVQLSLPLVFSRNSVPGVPRKSFLRDVCALRDRGGVPDLSVSGDNFDFGGSRPSRSDYDERTRSANAIAEPTPCGYRPCGCKISLITKINPCTQSKNAQEQEASNLNITRRWSPELQRSARVCA